MRFPSIHLSVCLLTSASLAVPACNASRWKPAAPASARVGPALPIGKCINYAGQLEVERDESWMRPVVPGDFREMQQLGFQSIRVPLNLSRFASHKPPYRIAPPYIARIRQVVSLATKADLNVILDNHLYPELFAHPDAEQDRFVAIWRQMGSLFSEAPPSVYFELLNEAHDPLTNARLAALFKPALAAIRDKNATRPVIVGGDWYNALTALDTLDMLDDANVVPTFHYYEPMPFTHQGASWTVPPYPKGATYGSLKDLAQLNRTVADARAYMERTGRVPFIGEYGAVESIPSSERAAYFADVTNAFASIGIQSCVWGYVNNFTLRDGKGWNRAIIDSISTVTKPTKN